MEARIALTLQRTNTLRLLAATLVVLPVFICWRSVTANAARRRLDLKSQLPLLAIRILNSSLTNNAVRWLADLGLPDSVLESPRYAPYRSNLFTPVSGPGFRGRWVVRGAIGEQYIEQPAACDVVILYLHGGGYFTSSPATYLVFLLRLAEALASYDDSSHDDELEDGPDPRKSAQGQGQLRGMKVAIFALDYDLAPEHRFPAQLTQATAAYQWLTHDILDKDTSKLTVAGDSAGAHLALSLMYHLHHPLHKLGSSATSRGLDNAVSKPGGLLLLSPWLSLWKQSARSFTDNERTDVLSASFLRAVARQFVGAEDNMAPGFALSSASTSIL